MIPHTRLIRFSFALILLWCTEGTAADRPASTVRSRTHVYVVQFIQNQDSPGTGNVADFATRLVELRLRALGVGVVSRRSEEPRCQLPKVEQQQKGLSSPAEDRSFYFVRASFQVLDSPGIRRPDIVLDYDLVKVTDCRSEVIFHNTEVVPEASVLGGLNSMANVMAVLLKRELVPKVVVQVAAVTLPEEAEREKQMAVGLNDKLLDRLAENDDWLIRDLRHSDPADSSFDYRVEPKLYLLKKPSGNPFRGFSRGEVQADFSVRTTDGHEYQLSSVVGERNKLAEFYKKAGEAAASELEDLIYARAANLTEKLAKAETSELQKKAEELLCLAPSAGPSCIPDPKTATGILEVGRKDERNAHASQLLGYAKSQAGDSIGAAQAYEKAVSLSPGGASEERLQLLKLTGDAWYNAQNYRKAAERYSEAIRLTRQNPALVPQPDIHLQRARSLRFAGEKLNAVQALLESLRLFPESKPLNDELKQVVQEMHGGDLESAVNLLEASRTGLSDPSTLARAHTQLGKDLLASARSDSDRVSARKHLEAALALNVNEASLLLELHGYLAGYGYSRHDYTLMDDHLKQAEALMTDATPSHVREWILRLRGMWWHDEKKDFAQAEKFLKQALTARDVNHARYELALTYLDWGHSSSEGSEDAKSRYGDALTYAAPLVEKRYSNADAVFRDANHALGKDDATRKKLEQIIAQNPRDVSALLNLMFLCNEYLKEAGCSLRAAQMLDKSGLPPGSPQLDVDIAEIEILNGLLERADDRLARVLRQGGLSPSSQAVAQFYRLWVALAVRKDEQAQQTFAAWREILTKLRAEGNDIRWVFEGAKNTLATRGVFPENQKQILLAMIAAMEKKERPIPMALP